MKHFLGALKPKADVRDYRIAAAATEYPESYLCENLPPVKNQRSVSSCVAHATAAILEVFNKTETGKFVPLSTNFIYGMQGIAFGKLTSGMYLRDACKIVKEYGNATEASIGGNIEQPKCTEQLKEKLTDNIYEEAKNYKVASYAKCKTINDICKLVKIGEQDKYTLKDKIIAFNKKVDYGYHAIMICGWNENGWICQNSWGRNWNSDGKFIYPYTEKFEELWSFVDAENNDIITPKNNHWLNYIYKLINYIINLIKGKG